MIKGSMGQREYRAAILKSLMKACREIKKLEKELQQKRFTKVYRDKKCKGALKQAEWLAELEACLQESMTALMDNWELLPEVCKGDEIAAMEFAAQLCARKRSRKYMKNQQRFLE